MKSTELLNMTAAYAAEILDAEGNGTWNNWTELTGTMIAYIDCTEAEDHDLVEMLRDNADLIVTLSKIDTIHIGAFPEAAISDFMAALVTAIFGLVAEKLNAGKADPVRGDLLPIIETLATITLDELTDYVTENY